MTQEHKFDKVRVNIILSFHVLILNLLCFGGHFLEATSTKGEVKYARNFKKDGPKPEPFLLLSQGYKSAADSQHPDIEENSKLIQRLKVIEVLVIVFIQFLIFGHSFSLPNPFLHAQS